MHHNLASFVLLLALCSAAVVSSGLAMRVPKVVNPALDESNDIDNAHGPLANSDNSGYNGGAILQKNTVRGPQDLALYYAKSPGRCGGMSTGDCSKDCGALGYPVYWCYAQVCYCHFGSEE